MTSGEYAPTGGYSPAAGRPAGLLVRWLARAIDGIIVVLGAIVLHLTTDLEFSLLVTGLFTGALMFLYFFVLEGFVGATLGKKLLGLRVLAPGGAAKPTPVQAAIRNCWTLLPIIPYLGGLLGVVAIIVIAVTINGSPTRQGKHDDLAGGTIVVKG
jgi:uncharacterized RDD family membrane protein YckC|nr:MAG: RDD family protein [Mycolicibacterium hassiacum]